MDRSKQETEAAIKAVMDAIYDANYDAWARVSVEYGIASYRKTGPNTLRFVMANKREVVVTVRGL